jgi:hypothetical protein
MVGVRPPYPLLMRRRPECISFALLCGVLCGCQGASAPPSVPAPASSEIAVAADSPNFAGGKSILSGFELGAENDPWLPGDQVLMGIVVEKAGAREVRYLKVTLVDPGQRPEKRTFTLEPDGHAPIYGSTFLVPTRIEYFDEQGRSLAESRGKIPEADFHSNVFSAADFFRGESERKARGEAAPDGDPEYEAAYKNALVGWFSLMNMGEALQSNRVFRRALEDAAEPPGLLAILFGDHSVTLSTRSDFGERGVAGLSDGVTLETYRVPMSLAFGKTKAMDFDVTAARIRAPLGLCGGVVSLDAHHPSREDRRVYVRLLACRRGTVVP